MGTPGDAGPHPDETELHATAVAYAGRAALILGPAGSGKSSLALECLVRGAQLIGDDRVRLRRSGARLLALPPQHLSGVIEARGVGLLHAPATCDGAPVTLAVTLEKQEDTRLPPRRSESFLDVAVPLCHDPATRAFPAAILLYLRGGRFA